MIEGVGTVYGEVISMENSAEEGVLATLDRIEGYLPDEPEKSFYTRKKIAVTTASRKNLKAWAYFLERMDLKGYPTIKSGIWKGGTRKYVAGQEC